MYGTSGLTARSALVVGLSAVLGAVTACGPNDAEFTCPLDQTELTRILGTAMLPADGREGPSDLATHEYCEFSSADYGRNPTSDNGYEIKAEFTQSPVESFHDPARTIGSSGEYRLHGDVRITDRPDVGPGVFEAVQYYTGDGAHWPVAVAYYRKANGSDGTLSLVATRQTPGGADPESALRRLAPRLVSWTM